MGAVVEFIMRGGPFEIVLVFCSIIMVALFLERLWTYRVVSRNNSIVKREVMEALKRGAVGDALRSCEATVSTVGAVLAAGLRKRHLGANDAQDAMTFAIASMQSFLERHLVWLSTIATVAPLLGFLGTVSGLYKAFVEVTVYGLGDPTKFAAGVAEALITTVTGLVIAIPANIAYNYFINRSDAFVIEMEAVARELIEQQRQIKAVEVGGEHVAAAP
ncbi:MAG: MotA/TolQ/ExbB proton channel family protein [Armatimonadota bacterium]|nr:MotA/TolQ/ExbB proton channel family protein [Armatimonadota bacterium]MCX7776491.1 MotA/TolQ/ExbB proton channel family protein [Armatimonadota bacterium]MDW8024288.1 MotA/TolQ/ExbB proton channel family protein [Armatimonadota bacterium]